MKIMISLLLSTAFCCFGLSAATAQTEDEYKSVRDVLLNYSNGQSDLMNLAGNALRPLTHGRDYFEASDVGTYQKINDARRRSQLLVRVLSFDLDGNMEVTRELTGAHGVNFLLAKDIPAPDGDPGHSCVKSEVDGKVVDGHCR